MHVLKVCLGAWIHDAENSVGVNTRDILNPLSVCSSQEVIMPRRDCHRQPIKVSRAMVIYRVVVSCIDYRNDKNLANVVESGRCSCLSHSICHGQDRVSVKVELGHESQSSC
jgi:hypothetical protein